MMNGQHRPDHLTNYEEGMHRKRLNYPVDADTRLVLRKNSDVKRMALMRAWILNSYRF